VTLLQYDHGIIRQVLDVIGEMLLSHKADKHVEDLKEVVSFLEQFMDRFHHYKEEKFLFPAIANELPDLLESLDKLRKEHAQARRMMKNATKALEIGDMERAEKELRKLVDHMTVHIADEENHVFAQAETFLALETDAKIQVQYERFMEKEFGKSYYQVSEGFANEIQERLLGPGFFKGIV